MIKKIFRGLGLLIVTFLAIVFIGFGILDHPLPDGTPGQAAEELANEMLTALNKSAYDTLNYIEFTFRGAHTHKWNKQLNSVIVSWDDYDVYVNLNQLSITYDELEMEAYEYFINDSFWLVAPFKIKDAGTSRSTVELPEGRGLLVTYSSGGLTPGDRYLWVLDERGFPKAWKLWTSNVPIGGLEFTWDGWVTINDVWFSSIHEGKLLDVPVNILSVR